MTDIRGHHDVGQRCPCVRRHLPIPAELDYHHVWPQGEGGPTVAANLVWLCPTAHRNVHELLRLYEHHGDTPPWSEVRHFNSYTRRVAQAGWMAIHLRRVVPI